MAGSRSSGLRQTYREYGTSRTARAGERELMVHQSNLTALLGLLPDDQRDTRDRVFELLDGVQHWADGEVWEEYRIRTTIYLGEMAVWLATLARGSQPPRNQDIGKAAYKRVLEYRRTVLEAELELL